VKVDLESHPVNSIENKIITNTKKHS
jgi:hypothetical protein